MRHDRCILLKKNMLMCQKVGWQGVGRVRQAVFLLKWFSGNDSAPHRSLSTTISASRVTYLPFSFPFNHHRVPDGLPLRHVVQKLNHMEHLGRENAPGGAEIGPPGTLRDMTGMRCLGGCQNLNDKPPVRVKNQRRAFSEDETTPTSLPAGKVTVSVWPI